MNAELKDWLLDCPALMGVSTLALDAGRLGLVDLRSGIALAVTRDVRLRALGLRSEKALKPAHHHLKLGRRPRFDLRIVGGAALLDGSIGRAATFTASPGRATLRLGVYPEAVVAALPGRPLSALITSALLDARPYVVQAAVRHEHGTDVDFAVPTMPIIAVRSSVDRVDRGRARP